jgi:hypothetical protein
MVVLTIRYNLQEQPMTLRERTKVQPDLGFERCGSGGFTKRVSQKK